MPKKVKIILKSYQDDGNSLNKINFRTDGVLYRKNNVYYLKYQENSEGLEGVETTLKIKDGTVTLIRQGQLRMLQEFTPQKRSSFVYNTFYGKFNFEIEVIKSKVMLNDEKGEIFLKYQLHNGSRKISDNQLNINYEGD